MAQTIGQTLQKEREKRGMTIADVAHDTHIHADTIRGLEADDYSVFSSTTYARSFLQLYSRHLEVDADEALHDFDSVSENLNSGKFSYLKSVTDDIEPGETIHLHDTGNHAISYDNEEKRPVPFFLLIVVLLLLMVIPAFYFIGKKATSIEEASSIFKDAISSKGQNPNNNQGQQNAKNNTSAAESIEASDSSQADSTPALSKINSREQQSSRQITKSKSAPASSAAASSLQLKAVPVAPINSVPLEKTDTAQNRN